jgi:hypothetical protein
MFHLTSQLGSNKQAAQVALSAVSLAPEIEFDTFALQHFGTDQAAFLRNLGRIKKPLK